MKKLPFARFLLLLFNLQYHFSVFLLFYLSFFLHFFHFFIFYIRRGVGRREDE